MTSRIILIVEDEALIALQLEDLVHEVGAEPAGPFASAKDAHNWLDFGSVPDIAILEVSLRDGPCTSLAVRLNEVGTQLIFATCAADVPDDFADVTCLKKPYRHSDLIEALQTALQTPRDGLNRTTDQIPEPRLMPA